MVDTLPLPKSNDTNELDSSREPYELIIDKTLRSRAKRIQDETKEQLTKCLERVEHVCFLLRCFFFITYIF